MQYTRYRSVLSLRKGQTHTAGRNSSGKITVRHRGGGHKQAVRSLNWTRFEEKALIVGFEYDPRRNTPLAKLYHQSPKAMKQSSGSEASANNHSYILAPSGAKLFQELHTFSDKSRSVFAENSVTKLLQPGDFAAFSYFEPGDFIHSVEAFPGQGAVFARAAGTFCQVRSVAQDNQTRVGDCSSYAKVRLPSGSQRLISLAARATFGVVGSTGSEKKNLGKAGRARWLGWRPSVRGVARNPVDHPHGGGQGKTSGGRPSVTFKAWPTKGRPTRSSKRHRNFILSPREK